MKRGLYLSLTLLILVAFSILLGFGLNTTSAQNEAPTLPPTNTPREGEAAAETPTPSLTPSPTLSPTASETPSPSITPTTIGPNQFPDSINPLTGLPYPSDEARDRRTLILKISNFPEVVRPQTGLSFADIIYEYEVEGGVTRFAAFFRSQSPEMVGSIRSGRLMDIELVTAYNALLGYSGSNEWVRQYILNSDWRWRAFSPQIGNNCPLFCRIHPDSRAFEHTLFANTVAIWQEAERIEVNDGMIATGMAFNTTPDQGGEPANDIAIDWYSDRAETRWQYNPTDQKYYRWDSGLPHLDAATGNQLTTDNIVLLEVWHTDRPDVYESEIGGIALEHQIWGTGTAWVFRDGLWFKGEWYRNRDRGGVYIRYADGTKTPIMLKPGNTWFEVVRKLYPGIQDELWSVTVGTDLIDAQATAVVQSDKLTAVPAMTQTQFATWYGSPTPSATWTPTPTGTWQY